MVLNVKAKEAMPAAPVIRESRGRLCLDWLQAPETTTPSDFLDSILATERVPGTRRFAGFSLIVGQLQPRCWIWFRTNAFGQVPGHVWVEDLSAPGVYAVSNGGTVVRSGGEGPTISADGSMSPSPAPWSKCLRGHQIAERLLAPCNLEHTAAGQRGLEENLLETLLHNSEIGEYVQQGGGSLDGAGEPDEHSLRGAPIAGMGVAVEAPSEVNLLLGQDGGARQSAQKFPTIPIFISAPHYCTRTSVVVMARDDGAVSYTEREHTGVVHDGRESVGDGKNVLACDGSDAALGDFEPRCPTRRFHFKLGDPVGLPGDPTQSKDDLQRSL